MRKLLFLPAILLVLGFAYAAAPTLSSVSTYPSPATVTAGAAITFTATLGSAGDGLNFKLYVCKDGNTNSCNTWCSDTDLNSGPTTSECTYTTTQGDVGTKDYNAVVCDANTPASCSNIIEGRQFTVNAPADTVPPGVSVKDINGDTSAPYWVRTDQGFGLALNLGETSIECKWSDANWSGDYGSAGTACTTTASEAACALPARAQTTAADANVFYNCRDSAGNATGGIQASYGVDYTKPTGSVSASASQDSITATYSGTDSHSGVQKYEVKLDTGSFIDKGTNTSHTFAAVGNGDHNITLRITDAAGNNADYNTTQNVNYAGSAPSKPNIGSGSHPDEDKWYSDNSVDLNWAAISGASKYQYIIDGNSTRTPDSNNEETTSTTKAYSGLADGVYWFHLRACNSPGLCGETDNFRIRIDTTAPELVQSLSGFGQSDGTIYLTWGSPTDVSGIKEYIVYRSVFQKVGSRDFQPSDSGVKEFSGITSTSFTDSNSLEKGVAYYYRVQAVDNAGNRGSMTAVYKAQNSGTSCTLEITGNVPAYLRPGNLDVKISIGGGSISNAVMRVKLPEQSLQNALENQSGTSILKTVTVPADKDGAGYIEVEGKASNGTACKKQFAFTVDSADPAVQIISPGEGTSVSGTMKVVASASDTGSGIAEVSVSVDGTRIGAAAKSGDSYELQWNSGQYSSGKHRISVTATDAAGNDANAQAEVTVLLSSGGIFVEKSYMYDPSNATEKLRNAGVKDSLISIAERLLGENKPQRKLIVERTQTGLEAKITVTLKNTGAAKSLQVIESIPKGVIGSARDITSEKHFSVIQNDPIIKFDLGEVGYGEEASVTYSVGSGLTESEANRIADSFSSFAAPPIVLESDVQSPIETSQADDMIFWVFIIAVAILVLLIIIVVLGGGAFLLHRHMKNTQGKGLFPQKSGRAGEDSLKEEPIGGKFSFKK